MGNKMTKPSVSVDQYDFCGWVTKNDLQCGDGRIIRRDAFKHNDGDVVPLVWNHRHDDISNILGHVVLQNRQEGVYGYGCFNDTENGEHGKEILKHGDIASLSIYANHLQEVGNDVIGGQIKEVSLVLAGANPGAYVDYMIEHGEDSESEMEASYYEPIIVSDHTDAIQHADSDETDNDNNDNETVADVLDTLNDKQQFVVYNIIEDLLEEIDNNQGDEDMKHNAFDQNDVNFTGNDILSQSDMETIIKDGKKYGSLKESVLAHADDYGIKQIDYLFPDYKNVTNEPIWIKRKTEWVEDVMSSVHHTPFSRIKSLFADIREDDARAKGYIKGKFKKEEVFSLLKRTTSPTTVYKKQKIDRDDLVDITDFNVVSWLKTEMRGMIDEELARAFLIGDGRLASSDDKINEENIRPIWTDADLYTIKDVISYKAGASDQDKAKEFIRRVIKSRKLYKGSGNPVLYTTEDLIADCLLIEDQIGRRIYNTTVDLATVLRVSKIVPVEVMENKTREVEGKTHALMGILVNMNDYNVGADQGGALNMFDDFDIDYNQQKYLIETRCSGALVKPFSAIAYEAVQSEGE